MNKQVKKYLKHMKLSPFQKKVLSVVSKIPSGQVRSYKWVAKKAGCPNSFRGVGGVLSKNPLPFIIPCHRVIKGNYKLGGFMFGKRMKKELLCSEGLTVKRGAVIMSEAQTYGAKRT